MSCSIHDDEGSYGSMQVCNGICIYKACNANLPHCLVLARAMFPYSCCFHAAILYMAIEISDGALHKLCDSLCTCAAEQWREVCTCEPILSHKQQYSMCMWCCIFIRSGLQQFHMYNKGVCFGTW